MSMVLGFLLGYLYAKNQKDINEFLHKVWKTMAW